MDFKGFFRWLFSEAGAGWVFGAVSTVTMVVGWLRRKGTQTITCKEVSKSSLVEIKKAVKQRIEVSFDRTPVADLAQLQMEISNEGFNIIRDIPLKIRFPQGTTILDATYETFPTSVDFHVATTFAENELLARIPYLNPKRHQGQRITINVVVDGDVEAVTAIGAGEGWSVRSLVIPTIKQLKRRMVTGSGLLVVEMLAWVWYIGVLEKTFGIPRYEISLRSFIAALPFIAVVTLTYTWIVLRVFSFYRRRI